MPSYISRFSWVAGIFAVGPTLQSLLKNEERKREIEKTERDKRERKRERGEKRSATPEYKGIPG